MKMLTLMSRQLGSAARATEMDSGAKLETTFKEYAAAYLVSGAQRGASVNNGGRARRRTRQFVRGREGNNGRKKRRSTHADAYAPLEAPVPFTRAPVPVALAPAPVPVPLAPVAVANARAEFGAAGMDQSELVAKTSNVIDVDEGRGRDEWNGEWGQGGEEERKEGRTHARAGGDGDIVVRGDDVRDREHVVLWPLSQLTAQSKVTDLELIDSARTDDALGARAKLSYLRQRNSGMLRCNYCLPDFRDGGRTRKVGRGRDREEDQNARRDEGAPSSAVVGFADARPQLRLRRKYADADARNGRGHRRTPLVQEKEVINGFHERRLARPKHAGRGLGIRASTLFDRPAAAEERREPRVEDGVSDDLGKKDREVQGDDCQYHSPNEVVPTFSLGKHESLGQMKRAMVRDERDRGGGRGFENSLEPGNIKYNENTGNGVQTMPDIATVGSRLMEICERVIGHDGVPASEQEIHNRWLHAINERIEIDRNLTNHLKFVLETWKGVIKDEDKLPDDWLRGPEVLVGIAPKRSLRPPSPPVGRRGRNR
ncbi:hypothetical protein B0H11DRAFT_2204861 [Mycena galericulata]|nr:hypothetical protein B0H11DRAFT_2204861 [Mycena galericulata]